MNARVLRGTKEEIVQQLANLEGDVREAIVFIEQPCEASTQPYPLTEEDPFLEMEPYMVHVGDVDYSREAMYSRKPGE
jgi:hypothetical protein